MTILEDFVLARYREQEQTARLELTAAEQTIRRASRTLAESIWVHQLTWQIARAMDPEMRGRLEERLGSFAVRFADHPDYPNTQGGSDVPVRPEDPHG